METLLPFVKSLLENSSCGYRLVSNYCTSIEEETLKRFCDTSTRLTFHSINSNKILQHHEVLELLLKKEDGRYFAFMDSDIIATEEFDSQLLMALRDHDAVFSALPVWHEASDGVMPRSFKIMGGRFLRAHNKFLLGLSYCSVYKKDNLLKYIDESGIDLSRYNWENINSDDRKTLQQLELDKHFYDTAKLLNILWQHKGAKMVFKELGLIHLGGISGESYSKQEKLPVITRAKLLLPPRLKTVLKFLLQKRNSITLGEAINLENLIKKRSEIRKMLVNDSFSGKKRNIVPKDVMRRMMKANELSKSLIQEYLNEKKITK